MKCKISLEMLSLSRPSFGYGPNQHLNIKFYLQIYKFTMNEKILWINALTFITTITIILAHPTSEEPSRTSKGVPTIMQTLLSDIARELISRSTTNNQVKKNPTWKTRRQKTLNYFFSLQNRF